MHDNHKYNLLNQLTEEDKALWRIKKMYKKDAGACKECKAFWNKLEKIKEGYVKELTALVKKHLK